MAIRRFERSALGAFVQSPLKARNNPGNVIVAKTQVCFHRLPMGFRSKVDPEQLAIGTSGFPGYIPRKGNGLVYSQFIEDDADNSRISSDGTPFFPSYHCSRNWSIDRRSGALTFIDNSYDPNTGNFLGDGFSAASHVGVYQQSLATDDDQVTELHYNNSGVDPHTGQAVTSSDGIYYGKLLSPYTIGSILTTLWDLMRATDQAFEAAPFPSTNLYNRYNVDYFRTAWGGNFVGSDNSPVWFASDASPLSAPSGVRSPQGQGLDDDPLNTSLNLQGAAPDGDRNARENTITSAFLSLIHQFEPENEPHFEPYTDPFTGQSIQRLIGDGTRYHAGFKFISGDRIDVLHNEETIPGVPSERFYPVFPVLARTHFKMVAIDSDFNAIPGSEADLGDVIQLRCDQRGNIFLPGNWPGNAFPGIFAHQGEIDGTPGPNNTLVPYGSITQRKLPGAGQILRVEPTNILPDALSIYRVLMRRDTQLPGVPAG